eukprot:5226824-Pleurochrysis_carterae.AAC.1
MMKEDHSATRLHAHTESSSSTRCVAPTSSSSSILTRWSTHEMFLVTNEIITTKTDEHKDE